MKKCLEANSWPLKSQFSALLEDQEGDKKPGKKCEKREEEGRRKQGGRPRSLFRELKILFWQRFQDFKVSM